MERTLMEKLQAMLMLGSAMATLRKAAEGGDPLEYAEALMMMVDVSIKIGVEIPEDIRAAYVKILAAGIAAIGTDAEVGTV